MKNTHTHANSKWAATQRTGQELQNQLPITRYTHLPPTIAGSRTQVSACVWGSLSATGVVLLCGFYTSVLAKKCSRGAVVVWYQVILLLITMGFYRSLPSVEVGIFSSVSIQSKYMHATTGTTLLPLQLLLLLQCDFRGHPSLIESFNIWMKYMFLLILGWVVNDIPLQLLYGCVPCVTRGISECFIFCRQSFVLCGRGNLPCKRHNKRMHQHTDKYYTTMLGGIMNKDSSSSFSDW